MLPEPASPELVLVDSELARRERARLEEKASLQSLLDVAPLRRAFKNQPPPVEEIVRPRPRWRDAADVSKRHLVPAALMCSLLVIGFLVADLVTQRGEEAAQVAVRIVTPTESVLTTPRTSAVPTGGRGSRPATKLSTTVLRTKGAVERRIVSLILSAPARKLPRNFIDPTTGLVKNNVQVACVRKKRRSFVCAVRLPSDSTSKALSVRYHTRKNGNGVFKWYGYKRS